MLPDGTYVMSQSQACKAIDVSEIGIRRFLQSDALKTLQGNSLGFDMTLTFNDDTKINSRGRIKVVPLEVVVAFWASQKARGNAKADALITACAMETLERRYDRIFGVLS